MGGELWSYVSSGDGKQCSLISQCEVGQRGEWCSDENKERINRLVDGGQFNINSCDF